MSTSSAKNDIVKGGAIGAILMIILPMIVKNDDFLEILQIAVPGVSLFLQRLFEFFSQYYKIDPEELNYRKGLKASIKRRKKELAENPSEERKNTLTAKIHELEDNLNDSLTKRIS